MTSVSLDRLIMSQSKEKQKGPFTGTLLTFDPGETTGFAWFKGSKLTDFGELRTRNATEWTPEIGMQLFVDPDVVVVESYRVYKWRTQQHAWSDLLTARLIGGIQTLVAEQFGDVPCIMQSAQNAKQFVTDDKLKEWDLYVKGKKHARDAIRHGAYYLLFNHFKDK